MPWANGEGPVSLPTETTRETHLVKGQDGRDSPEGELQHHQGSHAGANHHEGPCQHEEVQLIQESPLLPYGLLLFLAFWVTERGRNEGLRNKKRLARQGRVKKGTRFHAEVLKRTSAWWDSGQGHSWPIGSCPLSQCFLEGKATHWLHPCFLKLRQARTTPPQGIEG